MKKTQQIRKSLRLIASLLTITTLIVSLPLYAFATDRNDEEDTIDSEVLNDLVKDSFEVVELREENVKHFRLSDGSYVAAQYDMPVHYMDEDSEWQDIDNTLSSSGSEYATSNAKIKFAKKITGNDALFTLHDGNRKITMSLDGAIKKTAGKANNTVTEFDESATTLQKMMTLDKLTSEVLYSGILNGIDLQYIVGSGSVKENILVNKKRDTYSFTFTINLNNLAAELLEDGTVSIYDPNNGDSVYVIPAGYMFDAAGEYSELVSYALAETGNKTYSFTVTADSDWINAPDREFPVTIDPTISEQSLASNTTDTYIDESYPNGYFNTKNFLAVGSYSSDGHDFIGYWNGPTPTIPSNSYISNVTLNYYCQNYRQNDSSNKALYIEAYQITSSWSGTITWNQYVNKTYGTLAASPVDYVKVDWANGKTGNLSWDITNIARKWYDGSATKYGIALKQNGTAYNSALLSSSDATSNKPSVCVTYKNINGIESYWSTATQNAGIAGTGYVNYATGSLTLAKGLLSTTDSLLPYTPTIVYNSTLANKDYEYPNVQISYWGDYMPRGFKLSIQETIIKKSYTNAEGSTVAYYIWADSDGTEHYFLPEEGSTTKYYDEDGLKLELDASSSTTLKIKDSSNTTRKFTKLSGTPDSTVLGGWYLTSITDKNNNTVSFTFKSGPHPTTVSLIPNGKDPIDFLTISYNSSSVPSMIINNTTKEAIIFRYSSTPTGSISASNTYYLRQIDYAHGNSSVTAANWEAFYNNSSTKTNITLDGSATYTYDSSGRLTVAKDDLSKYEVRYTYTTAGKVSAIQEYANGSTAGQKITLSYNSGYTEVRTSGNDDVYGNSDDFYTRYVFDSEGRVVNAYSTDLNRTTIYGASAGEYENDNDKAKNSIKTSLATGGPSSSFLQNGGFEYEGTVSEPFKYWKKTGNINLVGGAAEFDVTSGKTLSLYQYVTLAAGEYTLSMDVFSYKCKNVKLSLIAESISNSANRFVYEVPVNLDSASGADSTAVLNFKTSGENFKISVSVVGGSNVDSEAAVIIDNMMLEKGNTNNAYNYVESGNFENFSINSSGTVESHRNDFWKTYTENKAFYSSYSYPAFNQVIRIDGDITKKGIIYQTIYSSANSGIHGNNQTYIVSGFARAYNQVQSNAGIFRIKVEVKYKGKSTPEEFSFDFQKTTTDWQFITGTFNVNGEIDYIILSGEYSYQPGGYAMFDNFAIVESTEDSVQTYEFYDDSGRLHYHKSGTYSEVYEYNSNGDLSRVANNRGELTDYIYDSKYNLTSVTKYSFLYDGRTIYPNNGSVTASKLQRTLISRTDYNYNSYGLVTSTNTYQAVNGVITTTGEKYLHTQSTYNTTSGSKIFGALLTETDSLGRTIRYYYNEQNGRLMATANTATKTGTCYTYDAIGNVTSAMPATYSSSTSYNTVQNSAKVNYTYNSKNLLETIKTNSSTYRFSYDSFGNKTSVLVGSTSLASYTYNSYNGKLKKVTYGNGFVVEYVYDTLDNLKEVWYTENGSRKQAYEYTYNAYGQMIRSDDLLSGRSSIYRYDASGKLVHYVECDSKALTNELGVSFYYNDKSLLDFLAYSLDYNLTSGSAVKDLYYSYSYDNDGKLKSTKIDLKNSSTNSITLNYDGYDRLTGKNYAFGNFKNTVSYTYSANGSYTSGQVETYTSKINSNTAVKYTYTYDKNGNITKITTSTGDEYRYVYDDLGQLIREDNSARKATYVYTYDNAGNILTKKTYALTAASTTPSSPTSTYNYSYGNANWGDLLTSYRGTTITYDSIGNPLSYYNGTSFTFTWQKGRQLAKAVSGSNTYSFEYNDDGIRTSKTVNGVKHTYHLNGSQIIAEEWGSQLCVYLYDSDGSPIGMQFRQKSMAEGSFYTYWFEKNLQGDIVAVYNDSGVKIYSYSYDAWGNMVRTAHSTAGTNSYATYNPFGYRGYYRDSETGFYYLQSRYYDPNTGRFLNADGHINANGDILGFNMFAYCGNNPVMGYDPTGEWNWGKFFSGANLLAVGIAAVAVATTVLTCGAAAPAMVAVAAVTLTAGVATTVNGVAEIVEAGTDYNFVRDGVMGGNEEAYNTYKNITQATAEIGTVICGTYIAANGGSVCFVAGTMILAEAGHIAIEDIESGDLVWANNPDTGETALKQVVQTFRNETTELIHVTVNGEEIVCTNEHPFYSPVKGWTAACQLRAGDILVTVNGEYVIVEQVQHELLENPVAVYNFEVEDFHTYYVGNTDVLVHNRCDGNNPLEDISYTNKVKSQMSMNDNHGFPNIVDNYGSYGTVTQITGADGHSYIKVQIPGSYKGNDGVFEYIFDALKTCNHRYFRIQ